MAIFVGSPLGLVGINSTHPNGDKYNTRNEVSGGGSRSLFTGNRILRPFSIGINNSGERGSGANDAYDPNNNPHSGVIYDTSISNILDKLEGTRAELKLMDFAYLKDVGVYPNNRLMVARRFAAPTEDNIMYNNDGGVTNPLVSLISWKPQNEDFLEISFGEEWIDVTEGDFSGILNEVGKDFGAAGKIGGNLSEGSGIIPLPGATELLQRKLFEKMGILKPGAGNQIPEGNPNIIKQAKQRKLVTAGKAGTGLTCKVSIKMVCVWEQKYILGIDPTLAWMDIIAMVGRFGTSTSQTYGLNPNLGSNIKNLLNNPDILIKKAIEGIKDAVSAVAEKIKKAIITAKNALTSDSGEKKDPVEEKKKKLDKEAGVFDTLLGQAAKVGKAIVDGIAQKYRERIIGIVNVLTGLPSTPWHITLGNPLRPTFTSGDMLTTNVKLNLGGQLSFNDLPTKITAEFTLVNAKAWGLQEIMGKFNSGYLRVISYGEN
jgi:hypothetical protein